MQRNKLYAGVARADITPDKGIILGGATISGKIPVDYIKDPLYANVLVLERDGRKCCIVTLDLLMITRKYADLVRDFASYNLGFERGGILISATQNHKAPALGHFKISEEYAGIPEELGWLRGGDERYHAIALEKITEAIRAADQDKQPVALGCVSGIEGKWSFNRRMVMRDGKVRMPSFSGPPDPDSLYLEGPSDPELGMMALRNASGEVLSVLLHYTCHPVHQISEFFISADWPGAWADRMIERMGPQCVPVVLNGPCGNINPWDPYAERPADDAALMGEGLASSAQRLMDQGIDFSEDVVLDWRIATIRLPLRELKEAELTAARAYVADHPEPKWRNDVFLDDKWVYASGMIDLWEQKQRQPYAEYEIQAVRLGDCAIVGLPGEPFAEGGLRIKLQSPARRTFVAHNTYFAGYIPTKEAFAHGGYETRTSNWSKFTPEALDQIVEASVRLLKDLFGQAS